MKVREIMTSNPVCAIPENTAQAVARMMCEANVGSIPVVTDRQSKMLAGIITDRDLACSLVAAGLDPVRTPIREHMHRSPVACRADEDLHACERAMQRHQIRRVPVVDDRGCCIGIVAQADVVLKHGPQPAAKTVAEVSRPHAVA